MNQGLTDLDVRALATSGGALWAGTRQTVFRFEDGQYRASTTGAATTQVLRSAATLPEDIRRQITQERRAGDPRAAVDPLADPAVRAAVDRARFEVMVGFELTPEQLRYNATR